MQITNYKKLNNNETEVCTVEGYLGLVGATFFATREGSGHNAVCQINIEGGQYDIEKPFQIRVTGEWEMMAVLEIMKLITPKI